MQNAEARDLYVLRITYHVISTSDMLPPLKVVGFLASSRSAGCRRSYVRSTSVYSVRVPPGQGEMLRIRRAWFSPDNQPARSRPRTFYPLVAFGAEPPKLNCKRARCEHLSIAD